jgi:hypothetical protein
MVYIDTILYIALALVACVNSRAVETCRHGSGAGSGARCSGRANQSTSCSSTGAANTTNTTAAGTTEAKAIYFMTNQANNSIIAIPVGSDGTLSGGTLIGTGGAGSNLIDTATNGPAAPDALASQGSVKVAGNASPPRSPV